MAHPPVGIAGAARLARLAVAPAKRAGEAGAPDN